MNAQSNDLAWELLDNSPQATGRHDDVFFLSPDSGWLVNGRGEIHKTTDEGATWKQQLSDGPYFRSVGFATDQLGWAGGLNEGQMLFETTDGGENWTNITDRIQGPRPSGICGLWPVSDRVIYGVGRFDGPPIFLSTRDGGQTWQSSDLTPFAIGTLIDVRFFDESTGIIVGGSERDFTGGATVALTEDGGETWTIRHKTIPDKGIGGEWGWKISFPSREVGYVSVEFPFANRTGLPAKVLKTVDGGLSWKEIRVAGSTEPAGLQGVGFITENRGWTSGRGTTSVTMDGGDTWQQIEEMDGSVNRIRVVNDTLAYAVGKRVYRLSPTATPTPIELPTVASRAFSLRQNYPNPFKPSTTIAYTLHRDQHVRVLVLNILSQQVRLLVDQHQTAGEQTVSWDGRDDAGRRLAAGMYLYLIDIGEAAEMKKMVMLN